MHPQPFRGRDRPTVGTSRSGTVTCASPTECGYSALVVRLLAVLTARRRHRGMRTPANHGSSNSRQTSDHPDHDGLASAGRPDRGHPAARRRSAPTRGAAAGARADRTDTRPDRARRRRARGSGRRRGDAHRRRRQAQSERTGAHQRRHRRRHPTRRVARRRTASAAGQTRRPRAGSGRDRQCAGAGRSARWRCGTADHHRHGPARRVRGGRTGRCSSPTNTAAP